MFGLGFPELIIILVIIIMVFGAGKLPEIGAAIGKGIKSFKKGTKSLEEKDSSPPQEDRNKEKTSP
jgi:sec-independent protein translocase protein TatA